MSEATTEELKEEGVRKGIAVMEVFGIAFFTLTVGASIVFMLRPLGVFGETFPRGSRFWLLFAVGFVFGLALYSLGASKKNRRGLSRGGGANYLLLGFGCAVELFLLAFYRPDETVGIISLWWLSIILSFLGTLGVYLPVRARRRELEREWRKQQEDRRKAHAKERRSPMIIIKVRRYYFTEKKLFDYKH
jgi:hypothetical protein